MRTYLTMLLICCLSTACQGQGQPETRLAGEIQVGGPCEGCEALYEWGDKLLQPIDTLPDFAEAGAGQPLMLTGILYQADGKTPAPEVILYIYHTNEEGVYPTRGGEEGWAPRHGYLRGWIKTGPDGRYTFYTRRPGSYPGRTAPAHIHVTLKEPGKSAYYLDDFVFADDPLLAREPARPNPRGSSGILHLRKEAGLWRAERDIVLGRNIPGYP